MHLFARLLPTALLLIVLAFFSGLTCRAGLTSYTDRGKTDFDTVLPLLNPYGNWSKIDGLWAYTPLDHQAPYTNGRWIYTEYGWYWKGNAPHSWATEHYGYWKRSADKVWSWYPGPYWLPEIAEIRNTTTHIGWRIAPVDDEGSFIEKPAERYAKTDEWNFVTLAQFAGPITPQSIAKPDVALEVLDDSTECRHTYFTYREIDRPGPHPADLLKFGDGGMLAPGTMQEALAAPMPPAKAPAAKGAAVPPLVLNGADPALVADTRKVKYWITMSLPSFWDKPPADAKAEEIYLYRPDFFQDQDGIERRVTLWFNPQARTSLKEVLAESSLGKTPQGGGDSPSGPATPAAPASSNDPFHLPLDNSYHQSANPARASSPSSKNPPAPSGAASTNAPIPLPFATNSAPANPH